LWAGNERPEKQADCREIHGGRLSISAGSHVVLVEEAETMQYLLLIYDQEKRWSQGYDPGEIAA